MTHEEMEMMIRERGGFTEIASKIGVTESAIRGWCYRCRVPSAHVLTFCKIVSKHPSYIRPDLYPPEIFEV